MTDDLAARVRALATALPGVTEKPSHGTPTWWAGKQFAFFWKSHHGNDFPHLWAAAPPGAQDELIASEPDRFFRPPYVGHRGWVGLRLDGDVDWAEVGEVLADAWRTVAPATLLSRLDPPPAGGPR